MLLPHSHIAPNTHWTTNSLDVATLELMAHGLSSQHTCNGCDRLASTLIGQLTAAKHRLDMKLKNKQPGVSAALVSIDILCLYFIQHLIPRIYSSHVL